MQTLAEEVMTECYLDVQELIVTTTRRFCGRHGGHIDDLLADANSAFVRGHLAIMAGRCNASDYTVEIRRYVWFDLFEDFRKRTGHRTTAKPAKCSDVIYNVPSKPGPERRLDDLLTGLSEDAMVCVKLVLETPDDLAAVAEGKGGEPRNWRSSIRAYLKGLGWCTDRINESFDEIEYVLTT